MNRLITVKSISDIPQKYRDTPIQQLLEYHNMNKVQAKYVNAEILIAMCMDNRKRLNIPDNFAFVIRTGGANLRYSEFRVSYAIGVGGVKTIALIGHNNCGMVNLMARREKFISGLVENAGWTKEEAEDHFYHYEPIHEIGDEINFIASEAHRIHLRYPKVLVAPMMYDVKDNFISIVG